MQVDFEMPIQFYQVLLYFPWDGNQSSDIFNLLTSLRILSQHAKVERATWIITVLLIIWRTLIRVTAAAAAAAVLLEGLIWARTPLWQSGKQSTPPPFSLSLSPSAPCFYNPPPHKGGNFPPYPFLGGLLPLARRQQEGCANLCQWFGKK